MYRLDNVERRILDRFHCRTTDSQDSGTSWDTPPRLRRRHEEFILPTRVTMVTSYTSVQAFLPFR